MPDLIIEKLENIRKDALERYPNYQPSTNMIIDIISEMIDVDYQDIFPGGKRFRVFQDYMIDIFKHALANNLPKSYLRDLYKVFLDPDVSKYLSDKMLDRSRNLLALTDRLKYSLTGSWQGYKNHSEKDIEKIIRIIDLSGKWPRSE